MTAAIYAGHTGAFELYEIITVATAAAAVLGDTMGFFIGRTLGLRMLESPLAPPPPRKNALLVGEYLFLFDTAERSCSGDGGGGALRVLAAVLAGANKMPWRRFAVMNALGGFAGRAFFAVLAYSGSGT